MSSMVSLRARAGLPGKAKGVGKWLVGQLLLGIKGSDEPARVPSGRWLQSTHKGWGPAEVEQGYF